MRSKLWLLLAVLGAAVTAAEPGLLFYSSFDSYVVDADVAKGGKKGSGLAEKDLQLRMFPGPNGKGNSLAINHSEKVSYKAAGNIDARKGTVSMWVNPINWGFSGDEVYGFFNYSDKGITVRLFKHSWGPYVIGQLQWKPEGSKKIYSRQVQMMLKPQEWGKGMWHHIAIAWDQDFMQLFIDGVLLPDPPKIGRPRFWNNKPAPPDYPRSVKPVFPGNLPETSAKGRIYIGDVFGNKKVPATHRIAIDEVKIYDRPLSANEIRKEYERVLPPAPKKNLVPHLVTVPEGENASVVMLRRPMSAPTRKINATAKLRHDKKNLYVSFFADFACKVAKYKENDSFLWEDDSFEVHLVSPAKTRYQFIVNGNGAVLDNRNRDRAWNSGVTSKVKLNKDSWQADLTIPLAALDKTDGLWLADFTLAQHLGTKTNYYRWSDIVFDNSFTATGNLMFGKTNDFVAPVIGPEFDAGTLDLKADAGKGITVSADYIPVGQKAIAYPGNLKHWKTILPAGKLQLRINAARGKKVIYRYYADCYIDYPLEVEFNTVVKNKKINLALNFSNAGGKFIGEVLPKGVNGTTQLIAPDGKVVSSGKFTTTAVKSSAVLPLPENLTQGNYKIRVSAGELSRTIDYRVPEMTPYKLQLGKDHSVPWPWHPVKELGKKRYGVLDRVFTFDGKSPLPASITIKNEELFKERPVLSFGGKPVAWSNFRVVNKSPDFIAFAADGKVDGGRLNFKGELWFDGMYKMDLALDVPKAETFFLNTAVRKDFGRYVLDPYLLPWKNNRITADVRGFNANEKRAAGFIWLTGYEKGMCFWTRSNANWINTPGRPSIDIKRNQNNVSMLCRIIDKKVTLNKTAKYTFVLQPTPPRVPKKDHRRFNFCSYGRCKETTHDFGDDVGRVPTSPVMVRPKFPKKFDAMYPHNKTKILIYTMPGHLNVLEPDMDLWDKNDRNVPGITHSGVAFGTPWMAWGYCTNATTQPADLWTWWIEETMKRHARCGGLYFDVATVRNCENVEHGCGGVDVFGQKYFSNDALGLRDFFMRVYKTIHKRKGDIVLHCHVAFIPFVHSFIDSFAPGENTFSAACRNLWYTYTEEFSSDIYLSELNWKKAGVPYAMILQQGRATDLLPALKKFRRKNLDEPENAIRSLTAMLLYDLNVWGHYVHRPTIDKYWRIRREINIDDIVDYYGYWVSDAVKSTTPNVFCGWFKWEKGKGPWQRVLVVSNFSRNEVKANLVIDWKKLGIAPAKTFRDLWNEKDMTAEELKNATIKGAHFMMIGIK